MRSQLVLVVMLAACASTQAPIVPRAPSEAPARDLATAKPTTPGTSASAEQGAKDPRVVDLDIIRITASQTGVGGGGTIEAQAISTTELFDQANAAVKAGETERAIGLYRKLVADFPDSKFAPTSLFDIAAILDKRSDLEGT
ncbi:MAG TPA: hypothetical protein VGG28_28210, partial [Kofleriaceae bacterium]